MEKSTPNDDSSCSVSLSFPPVPFSGRKLKKMPIRGLYNTIKNRVEKDLMLESSICTSTPGPASHNHSETDAFTGLTYDDELVYSSVASVQSDSLDVESRAVLDSTDHPPQGMSWLLESGRKKRHQLQLNDGQGNSNVYSTPMQPKRNLETPAKQMQPSCYITPQNKRTQLSIHQHPFEEDMQMKCSTILEEKGNGDVSNSCNKHGFYHVNDNRVVVSSLYSNTKSTRAVPLPSDSSEGYQQTHCQTPVAPVNDQCQNNLGLHHSVGHSLKRFALLEKVTALPTSVTNIQMDCNNPHGVQTAKEININQGQWQNTKPTRFHCNEDKENINFMVFDLSDKLDYQSNGNIESLNNFVALDLSDKLKEFKYVDKRKERVDELEAVKSTDVEYPMNLKVSRSTERIHSANRGEEAVVNPVLSVGYFPYKSNQSIQTSIPLKPPMSVQSLTGLAPSAHTNIIPEAHRPSDNGGHPVCQPTEILSPLVPLLHSAKPLDDRVINSSKPEVQCEAYPAMKSSYDQSGSWSKTNIHNQVYDKPSFQSHGPTLEQVSGPPHTNSHLHVNEMKPPVQPVSKPHDEQMTKPKTKTYALAQEVKPIFQTPKPLTERGGGQIKSDVLGQTNDRFSDMCALLNSQRPTEISLVVKNKTYAIMGQLGKGGSSVVYQVMDHQTNKQLAVKCVHLAGVDKESAQGYLNEIRLLDKLQDCDCVIKLIDYEFLQQSQTLYVVMEKGDTDFSKLLKDIAKTKKISSLMIAYYWTEMVNAVKCIHENGIIHSDLKPANFLLVSGRLKLIDFGIASSLNVDSTSVIKENVMGTFNYISPEAIQGPSQMPETRKISFKSDIWSLGCILYNLVYGRPPFAHIVHNMSKLCAITNRNHKINYPESSECPEIFIRIMKSCLRHNPKERPAAEELLQPPYLPSLQVPCSEIHNSLPTIIEKIKSTLPPDEWTTLERLLKCPGNHSQIVQ